MPESATKRIAVSLPPSEYNRWAAYLRQRRMTVSEFVRAAIEEKAARDGLVLDLSVQLGGKREGAGRPPQD